MLFTVGLLNFKIFFLNINFLLILLESKLLGNFIYFVEELDFILSQCSPQAEQQSWTYIFGKKQQQGEKRHSLVEKESQFLLDVI